MSIKSQALIRSIDNVVVNIVTVETEDGWTPPDHYLADLAANAVIDATYSGGVYTLPPPRVPSASEAREAEFTADATRIDVMDKLRNATLAQIDTYVDGKIASTNVTTLRNEVRVLFKQVLKVLALNVQK